MALPAYDQCIKASHVFNLLDARGVISVTERQSYILRVRELAKACGEAWLATEGGGRHERTEIGGREPIAVEVEAGETYWWCAAGAPRASRSATARIRDRLQPMEWTAERGRYLLHLQAHQTRLCDDSHLKL